MNAENAEYQILLALQGSHYRSRALDSLYTATGAVVCSRSSSQSRTLLAKAFYLTLLAARLEKLLCGQCNQALARLSRLKSLPDELQWQYRSAHSLGIARAVNRLGLLQDEIIGQVRQSLADVCALIMAQAPDLSLAIHEGSTRAINKIGTSSRLDPIDLTLLSLSPGLGKSMFELIARTVEQSKMLLNRARRASEEEASHLSIAAILSESSDLAEADLLASMAAYCLEATAGGGFADEPKTLPLGQIIDEKDRVLARLLAAGLMASRLSALLQRHNPTFYLSLN